MSVDLIRAIFTYVIASIVIVGGLLFLYKALFLPTESRDQLIIGAVIALLSAATSFVFGAEIATRSARQSERATSQGASVGAAATLASGPPPPPEDPLP